MILRLPLEIVPSALYRVVDLPEPVGPVTRISPWGRAMYSLDDAEIAVRHAQFVKRTKHLLPISKRKEAVSPVEVGLVLTRISSSCHPRST